MGVGGYVAMQSWSPYLSDSTQAIQLQAEAADCSLEKQACTAANDQAHIVLTLTPQPIPLMKPVQSSVQLSGLANLDAVQLRIEGVNMYMGFQSVQLNKRPDNEWQGSFSLPICSESAMHWRVLVNLTSQQQSYQATFNLATQR